MQSEIVYISWLILWIKFLPFSEILESKKSELIFAKAIDSVFFKFILYT